MSNEDAAVSLMTSLTEQKMRTQSTFPCMADDNILSTTRQ